MKKKNWFIVGIVSFAINIILAIPEHLLENNAVVNAMGLLRILCWIIILIALIGWAVSKK